jgi:hypothetical protein
MSYILRLPELWPGPDGGEEPESAHEVHGERVVVDILPGGVDLPLLVHAAFTLVLCRLLALFKYKYLLTTPSSHTVK